MKKAIIRILVTTASFLLAGNWIAGFQVVDWQAAFFAALVLGVLNAILKPILKVLALPITLLTLGLFIFIINGFLLTLISDIVSGVHAVDFSTAIRASLVVSAGSFIANALTKED
ncbi:phage holin family protein [Fusibacter sp. JL298sf-3]